MEDAAAPSKARKTGLVGVFVGVWTVLDGLIIGVPIIIVATTWGRLLITFAIGAFVWSVVNLWVTGWINRRWDSWLSGSKVEAHLNKIRDGKKVRRAVEWITRGSPLWFAIAAITLSAGQVIILFRIATGKATNRGQQLCACLAPAIFFSGLFSFIGWAAHKAING